MAIDTHGTLTFVNQALKRMLLYDEAGDDLINRNINEFVATESRGELWRLIHDAIGKGGYEKTTETKDEQGGSDSSSSESESDPNAVSMESFMQMDNKKRAHETRHKLSSSGEGSTDEVIARLAKNGKHGNLKSPPESTSSLYSSLDTMKKNSPRSESLEEMTERSSSAMTNVDGDGKQTGGKCLYSTVATPPVTNAIVKHL
jgi:hypothetical protein